jgi:hypothetical protein
MFAAGILWGHDMDEIPCPNVEACKLKHMMLQVECNEYTDEKFDQTMQLMTKLIYAVLGCAGAVALMVLERLIEVVFFL